MQEIPFVPDTESFKNDTSCNDLCIMVAGFLSKYNSGMAFIQVEEIM